jgi:2,4-didehydro-3-deoxy-L-rhamnonate hydrolase
VAGYTCFNDVTARAKSKSLQGKGHPWFLAKSRDTFGPLGPWVVPMRALPDHNNIRVSLTVNGEVKQTGTTAQMLNSIPALIAFLSKWVALLPGDVIATGTPPGVGSLKPGDTVAVTVDGIGTLENPVVGG